MKDKKKWTKISFVVLIVLILAVISGCLIWKMHAFNKVEIKQVDPPAAITPPIDKPFFSNSKKIVFTSSEKAQIINYSESEPYVKTEVFKYFFIIEFNKLGPNSEKLNFEFKFNVLKANKMEVDYFYGKDLKNTFIWYFVLK